MDENEEDNENVPGGAARADVEPKKSRKELMLEWKAKQAKIDKMKRKSEKPAFKTGVVQHSIAPFGAGAHKPNAFSVGECLEAFLILIRN